MIENLLPHSPDEGPPVPRKLPRWPWKHLGLLPKPSELKPTKYRITSGDMDIEVTARDPYVAMRDAIRKTKGKLGFLIKAKNLETGETTRYPVIGFLFTA